MNIEDKKLLIKDLSARLPYGVYIEDTRCGIRGRLNELFVMPKYKGNEIYDYSASINFYHDCYYDDIEVFKPYLFPLSSMTEEQKKEYDSLIYRAELHSDRYYDVIDIDEFEDLQEFYHKNHLDWRGFIPMGLAIDATGKNIY